MIRSTANKVMWVGRATVFMVGLSVILALVLGVATTAMGANGKPFLLGKKNVASAISTLVKKGPGPALSLVVEANQPPLKVNSKAKVANLNADTVDGLEGASCVQGGGRASPGMAAVPAGTLATILETSNPKIKVGYKCPSNPANGGDLVVSSPGITEDMNVFIYMDSASFSYPFRLVRELFGPLGGGNLVSIQAPADGAHFTIQAQGANVATIE